MKLPFVIGNRPIQGNFDALVKELGFYMRLENDVASAFTNGVTVTVPMDTVIYDPAGIVDLANGQAVIPRMGWWVFQGGALQTAVQVVGTTYDATVIGSSLLGAVYLRSLVASNTPRTVHQGTALVRCADGDAMRVGFFQNSGSNLTADGAVADFNFLRGAWVAP